MQQAKEGKTACWLSINQSNIHPFKHIHQITKLIPLPIRYPWRLFPRRHTSEESHWYVVSADENHQNPSKPKVGGATRIAPAITFVRARAALSLFQGYLFTSHPLSPVLWGPDWAASHFLGCNFYHFWFTHPSANCCQAASHPTISWSFLRRAQF